MLSDNATRGRTTRLVLFHGLASTPKEFGFLVHPLRRQGIRLEAPEVPGYSAGQLADPAGWRDWVESATRVVERLSAESPEPFVLGGLCTGSMLAVAAAAHRPLPGLQGLALMSPLLSYDGWGLPRWYALRGIAYALGLTRHFSMAERAPYGLKNERMRQWIRQQMSAGETSLVGPARVSLQVVRESERLSEHVRPLLRRAALPMLVQHAREDEICALASVQSALSAVSPQWLQMRILENSYHMITADNDRHLVAEQLADFLQGLSRAAAPIAPAQASNSSFFAAGPASIRIAS